MYAIYDLKENEMCVGVFDSCREVANYFETTENAIYSIVSRNQTKGKRFKIVSIKEDF